MSNLLRSLISGGSRVARSADDAAAVRYLDDLMKSERYADQVKYLDEFYGRTPQVSEPVVEVASRAPTTAEQFLAAGIPMPSAARRLADAADDAASAGLGPDNALLREWVDSQVPLPSANPRGSAMTSLRAIGDSFDEMLAAPRRVAADRLAQRRAIAGAAAQYAPHAAIGASAAGIGALAVADALDQHRREQEGARALAELAAWTDGVIEAPAAQADDADIHAALAELSMPAIKWAPDDSFRPEPHAFSDADLVEEVRPRPRVMGTYPGLPANPRPTRGYR